MYVIDEFIKYIYNRTTQKTQIEYIKDLTSFIQCMFPNYRKQEPTLQDFDKLTTKDLEDYIFNNYRDNEITTQNRHISSLKSFFKFLFRHDYISKNVAELINYGKVRENPLVFLELNEILDIIDKIESGENLSEHQLLYHKKTKTRDLCLFVLFVTTGCRISEIYNLKVSDIDLKNKQMKVIRKGQRKEIIYLNDETIIYLKDYLNIRPIIEESALFISLQGTKIHRNSISNIIKKYCNMVTPLKNITAHCLRKSYGMNAYRVSSDIMITAELLGHKNLASVQKYVKADEYVKIKYSNIMKLKDDN